MQMFALKFDKINCECKTVFLKGMLFKQITSRHVEYISHLIDVFKMRPLILIPQGNKNYFVEAEHQIKVPSE